MANPSIYAAFEKLWQIINRRLKAHYYTKSEIDNNELITVDDIDTICNASIAMASEVEV
jgi:hypothetical protein